MLDQSLTNLRRVPAVPGFTEFRFAPDTLDAEARTIDLVWSTGAPVRRRSFDGVFMEVLSMKKDAVRLERLNNGAPLLDSHWSMELKDVIGVVTKASVVKGEGRATVQFSRRDGVEGVFQDVQDGVLRNVSVGYRVHKFEESKPKNDDSIPVRLITDWEPHELSIVPIAADDAAKIRAAAYECSGLICAGADVRRARLRLLAAQS